MNSSRAKFIAVATVLVLLVLFVSCPTPTDPIDTTDPDPDPGPTPNPQISITWEGTTYTSAATVDIGYQFPGTPTPVFTINNVGTDAVVMSTVPPVVLFDDDGTDDTGLFSIPTQPSSPLNANESTQVEIAYLGGISGTFNFKIRVRVDDLADDYTLAITGFAQI